MGILVGTNFPGHSAKSQKCRGEPEKIGKRKRQKGRGQARSRKLHKKGGNFAERERRLDNTKKRKERGRERKKKKGGVTTKKERNRVPGILRVYARTGGKPYAVDRYLDKEGRGEPKKGGK